MDVLQEMVLEEHVIDDNAKLSAEEIHSYLTRVMYNRRNKMDPLWNTLIVAGVKDNKVYVYKLVFYVYFILLIFCSNLLPY